MEEQITDDVVKITPKTLNLRAEELVKFRETNVVTSEESASTSLGVSSTNQCGDQKLDSLYAELRMFISTPRIDRLCARSLAIWDDEKCMARVVRRVGKFEIFGTTLNHQFYLKYFEALYLMETGRLQLNYHDHTISVEQAYLLLLGEIMSKKYCEYLVYAYLTRTGYILVDHQNKRFQEGNKASEIDCIWAWLISSIERKPVPNHLKKLEMYAKVKRNLEIIKGSIINQGREEDISECMNTEDVPMCSTQSKNISNKRKIGHNKSSESRSKYCCTCPKSFLDFMKDEPEYMKFMNIFQKFDIIKMKTTRTVLNKNADNEDDDDNDDAENNDSDSFDQDENVLKISFDLYLHNKNFRKSSPDPPLMRVIVLPPYECFPTHSQLSVCVRGLLHSTPILIVSVGESKQIQAFLYFLA